MQNKHFILITSGILKGRKISVLSSQITRSTKARVADSFFNSVRQILKNSVFIELFGGSGLMAIRAVSEGANTAHAIECDKSSFEVLNENINKTNQALEQILKFQNFKILNAHFGDTFILTPKIVANNENIILYADPPFDIRQGFIKIYDACQRLLASLPKDKIKLICIEHLSATKLPENIGEFALIKQKAFGNSTLSYYKIL